ncbi:tetratricopeptide repeat protein [Kushneria phosphatilytica]|uniref:Uncharacterized protein n=1 Tax=Kushneria phosphatilytica TaxID=657387 RepID=A0A5C0ZV90_9GAMM|nr:tetratricopeptide repeat protein [Kushneria phosphatilytica]QEL10490.1 hypothetical protein FY550_04600 [Kushneria phosphatilytica]
MLRTWLVIMALLGSHSTLAADHDRLAAIQQRWAEIQYRMPEEKRADAFEQLAERTRAWTSSAPGEAPAWIWQGIVLSSWAGAEGGLSALGKAKEARGDFEKAIAINPFALKGSAYTSLAVLYDRVPGWPIGFGDSDKAEKLLEHALNINPGGVDTLYFWADHLYREGEYARARTALLKAQKAAPRAGRELADQGRQQEIATLLSQVEAHLN